MAIHDVGREEDVPPGQALSVYVDETPVAIFNVDGTFYALTDNCSHEDYPLSEGDILNGCEIECALHGARFDLRTGEALGLPATEPVATYPVWVEDGVLKVELP